MSAVECDKTLLSTNESCSSVAWMSPDHAWTLETSVRTAATFTAVEVAGWELDVVRLLLLLIVVSD